MLKIQVPSYMYVHRNTSVKTIRAKQEAEKITWIGKVKVEILLGCLQIFRQEKVLCCFSVDIFSHTIHTCLPYIEKSLKEKKLLFTHLQTQRVFRERQVEPKSSVSVFEEEKEREKGKGKKFIRFPVFCSFFFCSFFLLCVHAYFFVPVVQFILFQRKIEKRCMKTLECYYYKTSTTLLSVAHFQIDGKDFAIVPPGNLELFLLKKGLVSRSRKKK